MSGYKARRNPRVDGVVSQQYELLPDPRDPDYRRLQKEKVSQIGEDRRGRARDNEKLASTSAGEPEAAREPVSRKPREKKDMMVRKDNLVVQEMLFKLYEVQERWTTKALVAETTQPEPWLKSILQDIAIHETKGGACTLPRAAHMVRLRRCGGLNAWLGVGSQSTGTRGSSSRNTPRRAPTPTTRCRSSVRELRRWRGCGGGANAEGALPRTLRARPTNPRNH